MVTSWLLLPNHNVSHLDLYFPIKIPILVQEPDWNPWNYHFPRSFSIFFPPFFRHFPLFSPHFFICFIIVLDNFIQFPTFSHHFLTIFPRSPHLSAPPSVPRFVRHGAFNVSTVSCRCCAARRRRNATSRKASSEVSKWSWADGVWNIIWIWISIGYRSVINGY